MDEEGADSRRDGPQGDLEGFELEVVGGIDEAGDEQDRPDGDEDILTEEQPDGVRRGGVGAQLLTHLAGVTRVVASRGGLSHRHDERAHRLGWSTDGRQPHCSGDLANGEVDGEELPGRHGLHLRHQTAGLLHEAVALEQSDDGQDDDEDRHGSRTGKSGAEGLNDLDRRHAGNEAGSDTGDCDHEHGVEPQREADDDDRHGKQNPHGSLLSWVFLGILSRHSRERVGSISRLHCQICHDGQADCGNLGS